MCFGLGVENLSNQAVLFYTQDANQLLYRTFSTSWSGPTLGMTLSSNGNWIFVASDYESDRLAIASGAQGNDFRPMVWKANGSTEGITAGNNDTGAESMAGNNVDGFWEKRRGDTTRRAIFVYTDSNALKPSYETATCDGTGCTFSSITAVTGTNDCADDCSALLLRGNPHGNDMIMIGSDILGDLAMWRWSGSAWALVQKNLSTAGFITPHTSGDKINNTEFPHWYEYYRYSPWLHNWRWYDDEGNEDPSTPMANENIGPSGVASSNSIRLRLSIINPTGAGQTDARKKLQYSTDQSSWTDVDAQAGSGMWRYCDGGGSDDAVVTSYKLTAPSSPLPSNRQYGPHVENGTAASTFDHSALYTAEFDYCIQNNSANPNTTYYFRAFDNDQNTPVDKFQAAYPSTSCAGSVACSYPSLTTAVADVITVSGGCFTDAAEGTACTDDGSNEIKVAVNGVVQSGVDTTVDGDWSFTINKPLSGAVMVFFINGEATETEEATTVTKYDGDGNVDYVKMYQSQLVIGTDTGSANSDQTITNSDMDSDGGSNNGYESTVDDEDVLYDISAGNDLTVDAGGNKTETLYIISGDTFQPASAGGGDTITHHLYVEGTLTADNNAINVAGDFTNTGTFTANSSTVTFDGSVVQTITSGGSSFNLVVFNNSSASDSNINYTGALSIGNNVTLSNATRIASTDNTNFTVTTGTVNSTDDTDRALTIASGTADVSIGGAIGATNDLASLTITGNDITLANIGAGSAGVTGATTITGTTNGGDLATLNFMGTTYNANQQTYTAGAGNNFAVGGGAATTFTSTNDAIAFNTADIVLSNDSDLTVTSAGGAITALAINGTSSEDVTLTSTGGTTNTISIGAIGTLVPNSINTVALTASASVTLSGSITTSNAVGNSVTVTGPALLGADITVTTDTAGTDGAVNFTSTVDSTGGARTSTVAAGDADVTIGGAIGNGSALSSLTITGNDITLANIGAGSAGVTGAASVTGNATGTITLTGTTYNTAGTQVYDAGGAARTITLNENTAFTTTDDSIDFTGVLDSQAAENNSVTLSAGTAQITFNNNVGATQSIGVLTKEGFGDLRFGSSTLTCAGLVLSAGTVNNAGTDSGVWTVNGNITISSGTLRSTTNTLIVAGNWSNSGAFTHNSGTLILNGTSQQTLSGTMTGTSSFHNLTITNNYGTDPQTDPSVIFSASADATTATFATASTKLRFNAGSTYTFTNINFNGQGTGTRLTLRSSNPGTQWNLVVTGTQTVLNTDAKDSNACSGDYIDATDLSNYDSLNNDCWIFKMLEFTISSYSINFGNVNPGDPLTTDFHTIATTTNAQNGYITRARAISSYASNIFRHKLYPASFWILDWTGTNDSPLSWASGEGFGYHTDDYSLTGGGTADRFSPDKYAKFITTQPGDPVADRTGPSLNAQNTITYKLGTSNITAAGPYEATIVYICTATY